MKTFLSVSPTCIVRALALCLLASFTVPTSAGLKAYAVAVGAFTPEGTEKTFRLVIVDATEFPWQSVEIAPNP